MINRIKIPKHKKDSDFLKLFKEKEFDFLAGVGSEKIIKLSGIIFCTLLTLSYALGSLDQLKERMENPYTNWVDMPLTSTGQNNYDSLQPLLQYFSDPSVKKQFDLNDISGYVSATAVLLKINDFSKKIPYKCRSIRPDEKILGAILENKNVLNMPDGGISVFQSQPCGIIVKKSVLDHLGIQDWKTVKKVPMLFYDDIVYVEVVGVVKDLPDYCDIACTPRFYNLLISGSNPPSKTGVINTDTTNIVTIASPLGDIKFIENVIREKTDSQGSRLLKLKQEKIDLSNSEGNYLYELIFNHGERPDLNTMSAIFSSSNQTLRSAQTWSCIPDKYDEIDKPYSLAFNFTDLGKVREFKALMGARFKMNINLAQVESKDNFKKVTEITWIVCSTLFVFGILSIVLFITNLLNTHIENMKPNLGTLKAFGLKNNWLQEVYYLIIFYFLLFAFAIAALPLIIIVVISDLLFKSSSPFDLFNLPILVAVAIIFVISLYFSRRTTGKIVQSTPGDLIYGR